MASNGSTDYWHQHGSSMVSVGSKDHEHHHGLQWQYRSPSVAWLPAAAAQATVVPQGDPIQKMRHSSYLISCSESYLSCSWAACRGRTVESSIMFAVSSQRLALFSPQQGEQWQRQQWLCAARQACRWWGTEARWRPEPPGSPRLFPPPLWPPGLPLSSRVFLPI